MLIAPIRAFSSEVDTGSREENASEQKNRAPFRFNRNGNGSGRFSILLLAGLALCALAPSAMAEQVARERDIINLRLGQRIQVDDGSCPTGQIKEVSGAQMTATRVVATRKCIPRLGTKKR